MMNAGKIVLDIKGEEKKKLTVEALLAEFTKASGAEFASDRALLS
jgi:putative ABC transport system ATP-binding protein